MFDDRALAQPRARERLADVALEHSAVLRPEPLPGDGALGLRRAEREHAGVVRRAPERRLPLVRGAVAVPVVGGGHHELCHQKTRIVQRGPRPLVRPTRNEHHERQRCVVFARLCEDALDRFRDAAHHAAHERGVHLRGAAFEGAGVGEFEEIPSRAERRVDVRKRRTKTFRVVAVQWGRERLERHARGGAKRRENARPDAGLKAVPLDGLVPEQKREQTRVERAAFPRVVPARGVRLTRARLRLLLRVQRTGGGVFVVRVRMIRIGAVRTNAPSPRL